MSEKLIEHARENIWCSPQQDYQHILHPVRITTVRGARSSVEVEWRRVELPDNHNRYHVYAIGQLSPVYLNLLEDQDRWYSLTEVINKHHLIVDTYINNGLQVPRFDTFILRTRTKNVLVAVVERTKTHWIRGASLYLRFYTNAFFNTKRYRDLTDVRTQTDGVVVNERRDAVVLQQKAERLRERIGHLYFFHNGWLCDRFHMQSVELGDTLEYVHDPSIYHVLDFPVRELKTFSSIKDAANKYLLSRFKGLSGQIDYVDDLDFWLYQPYRNGFKGIYYHKNQPWAVRQVTHRDYSVPVSSIVGYANEFEHWRNPQALTLRLHIRRSGYERPLVYEHNRIHELYRLDADKMEQAMVGVNATLEEWRAANLEASRYVELMHVNPSTVSRKYVQDTYGYNAATKVLADTPVRVENLSGPRGAILPFGLRENVTVFEYTQDGLLIDWHWHDNGSRYWAYSDKAYWLEVKLGEGGSGTDTHYGFCRRPYEAHYNYRLYRRPGDYSVPNEQAWVDVSDQQDILWKVKQGEIGWVEDFRGFELVVRSDRQFLCQRLTLTREEGVLKTSLLETVSYGSQTQQRPLQIPFNNVSVFLNGFSLIEDLDYYIRGGELTIVNKQYLTEALEQDVVVRCDGHCASDLKRRKNAEKGFVTHHLLSHNKRYDVRDDKVLRMVVEGRLFSREDLVFSEHDTGVRMPSVRNGAPYVIEDPIIPLRNLMDQDVYEFRDQSRVVDEKVSAYLTRHYPEAKIDGPSVIPRYYHLYSPFISALHFDLKAGRLKPEGMKGQYSDRDLKFWLASYEPLLEVDPAVKGFDERYVVVHPHTHSEVTYLDIYQYNLLRRAIKVYLDNRVDLTHSVNVIERWI